MLPQRTVTFDPKLATLEDKNTSAIKQANWSIITQQLKKFGIRVNGIERDKLSLGDHSVLKRLFKLMIKFDQSGFSEKF